MTDWRYEPLGAGAGQYRQASGTVGPSAAGSVRRSARPGERGRRPGPWLRLATKLKTDEGNATAVEAFTWDAGEQPSGGHANLDRLGASVVLGVEQIEQRLGGIVSPGLDKVAHG
jgi:hypothetical protein